MLKAHFAAFSLLATVTSGYAVFAGCSSGDDPPSTQPNTETGVEELAKFEPKGCGYTVVRAELQGVTPFELHTDVATSDPRYVRRGLGGSVDHGAAGYADPSTSFTVGWQSDHTTLASQIRYGDSPDKLDKTADGFSYVVPQQGKVGPIEGIRFHEAHVCALSAGRTIHYQVGGAGKWSPVYSTTTGPVAGSADEVKIGIAGDSRDALGRTDLPVWRAMATRFKSAAVPVVLFSGDMVFSGLDQNNWESWSKALGEAGTSVFVALAPGNHEMEMFRSFAHMLMPGAPTANNERYASFDYGPVHIVMLDDYAGIISPSADSTGTYAQELSAWLDKDLGKAVANRASVPWIVTFHHHPVYSDGTRTERVREQLLMRAKLQPLFDKYKVDLDLAGHDHFYERFKPLVAGDKEDPNGTIYLLDGAGGAPSYDIKTDTPLAAFKSKYDPDKGEGIYGIASATPTKMTVKVYMMPSTAGTSPADDTVLEEFDIAKK
jgi:hypothetical protein